MMMSWKNYYLHHLVRISMLRFLWSLQDILSRNTLVLWKPLFVKCLWGRLKRVKDLMLVLKVVRVSSSIVFSINAVTLCLYLILWLISWLHCVVIVRVKACLSLIFHLHVRRIILPITCGSWCVTCLITTNTWFFFLRDFVKVHTVFIQQHIASRWESKLQFITLTKFYQSLPSLIITIISSRFYTFSIQVCSICRVKIHDIWSSMKKGDKPLLYRFPTEFTFITRILHITHQSSILQEEPFYIEIQHVAC